MNAYTTGIRKIIHIDMDCFYAAIEIRDNPWLATQPVAVGGSSDKRGVLCTCNYIARKFGVRSAMATAYAYKLCPDLIVLPVNMEKYKHAAEIIHGIFREFTDLVEPLSLDEAYIDVTDAAYLSGSGTLIAKEIRKKIWDTVQLTASAGVSINKFLAKIASGWKKPNGLFVIPPDAVSTFIKDLPVTDLFGVGKVTANKLHNLGLQTCADLQRIPLVDLVAQFGKFGYQLHEQSRGMDSRPVDPHRVRKSLSVETTFDRDKNPMECKKVIDELYVELKQRLKKYSDRIIKNQYLKIKFSDFRLTTIEKISQGIELRNFHNLFEDARVPVGSSVRLLGLGVHFVNDEALEKVYQHQLL